MRKDQVHNRVTLKENRKSLRETLTPAETVLWRELKGQRFQEKKFRRQHSIGCYIADFYCASEKLIIELDGGYHDTAEQKAQDRERDETLIALGFKILRFENKLIFMDINAVLKEIEKHFR